MVRVYYFEKFDGSEVLRVSPSFDAHPPDIGSLQMTYGKWSYIVEYLTTKTRDKDKWPNVWYCDGGGATSALCHYFFNCNNCPIRLRTGRYACFGTPFELYKYETTLENATDMRDYLFQILLEEGIIG